MWGNRNLPMFPLRRWIIDHDIHGLLDGPWGVMCFPINYGEVVYPAVMPSDVGMVIDEFFPEPLPKGHYSFPYVHLITIQFVTLLPVNYSAFYAMLSMSFGAARKFLMVLLCFKWTWTPPCHKYSWSFCLTPWCRVPPYGCCCGTVVIVMVVDEWLLLLFWAWVMLSLWLLLIRCPFKNPKWDIYI